MPRYIDVDKEIREINEVILEKEYAGKADEFTTYCFRRFADALSKAPTADVQEVKHAHWKDECCTNCGTSKFVMKAVRGFDEVIYEYEGEANYCPNCGAKMEGEVN